jgi:hypothetical protein
MASHAFQIFLAGSAIVESALKLPPKSEKSSQQSGLSAH